MEVDFWKLERQRLWGQELENTAFLGNKKNRTIPSTSIAKGGAKIEFGSWHRPNLPAFGSCLLYSRHSKKTWGLNSFFWGIGK
jgi:hypothetical protein